MKILVINPNTSTEMTEDIRRSAMAAKQPSTEIVAVNPQHGPECVEGTADELMAAYQLLAIVEQAEKEENYDAYIVACFGDPGVDALRELTDKPVIGVAGAAIQLASFIGAKFSIVSILPRCLMHLEELAARYSGEKQLASIKTPNIGVLDFHTDPESAQRKLIAAAREAVEEDLAETVILGCAGMSGFAGLVSRNIGVPVIDSVTAAVKTAEALVDMGLKTSKRNTYASPTQKNYR